MKIDNISSHLFGNRAQPASGRSEDAAAFSAALTKRTSKLQGSANDSTGVRQADFTEMTRQELRDWTNQQVRSGQMTLDESFPLVAMTMKIPVGGNKEIPAVGDHERIDFVQRARLGIEGALAGNDMTTAQRLEIALSIMLKGQGQTMGVNLQA